MKIENFLDCYLNYEAKAITIINYDETDSGRKDVYSIKLANTTYKNKESNYDEYKKLKDSKEIAFQVIQDFFKNSKNVIKDYRGMYRKTDLQVFDYVNEKGCLLRLISKQHEKSFPLIYENEKNNIKNIFIKLKEAVEKNNIKNIIIKTGDSNFATIKQSVSFPNCEDLEKVLIIKVKKVDEHISKDVFDSLNDFLLYYIKKNAEKLNDIVFTIDRHSFNSKYNLVFDDGIIFLDDNELIRELIDVKTVSKKIINERVRR